MLLHWGFPAGIAENLDVDISGTVHYAGTRTVVRAGLAQLAAIDVFNVGDLSVFKHGAVHAGRCV